jgi:hypothetical protein
MWTLVNHINILLVIVAVLTVLRCLVVGENKSIFKICN